MYAPCTRHALRVIGLLILRLELADDGIVGEATTKAIDGSDSSGDKRFT